MTPARYCSRRAARSGLAATPAWVRSANVSIGFRLQPDRLARGQIGDRTGWIDAKAKRIAIVIAGGARGTPCGELAPAPQLHQPRPNLAARRHENRNGAADTQSTQPVVLGLAQAAWYFSRSNFGRACLRRLVGP